MRRRSFLRLLGASAATWPIAARAQQGALPVVGVLGPGSRSAFEGPISSFSDGLRQQGYVEDRNVVIQYNWADGHFDLLPTMAAEFVRRRVAVIATFGGTVTAEAAKAATSTIPIVFVLGTDPVANGLVASLNRPGSNLTGATNLTVGLARKRVELLRDLLPNLTKMAVLINPINRTAQEVALRESDEGAALLGIQVRAAIVSSDSDFEPAFEKLAQDGVGALDVSSDPFHLSRRERIVALAARYRISTVYSSREYVKAGGLMSYGASAKAAFAIAGAYAGRILKGEKPADLPVVQPATFELAINLKAAKALGIDFPPIIAARATEVIE